MRPRVAVTLVLLACGLAGAGCTSQIDDTSAPYFNGQPAATTPGASSIGPGAGDPAGPGAAPGGPVSRPDPSLTPGVVAVTDVTALCKQSRRTRDAMPVAEQAAVFTEYKITVPKEKKYALDYLVPIDLGGSPVERNIWPASRTGIGFHEKAKLDVLLRTDVCQGVVDLATVQKQMQTDWYTLWLQYGAG